MADGSAPVRTTCPYCGVGCGVAAVTEGRALAVTGDKAHPANLGRLCSKGAALGSTVGLEGRLLVPMIGPREASWREATALVARRFAETIERHGPDSVAFYVSGQLLTEDYYAANKLMKGFIGSGNIDTNSRLCMASAVTAHKLAFGADLVPGCYEDLDLADLVVFSGHNAAWTHPVLFRRMEAARGRGQRHVVIDPRRTDTAEVADLHLALAPQTDVRLWNGLLADLMRRGAVDRGYVAAHVAGFAEVEAALAAEDQSLYAVARDCGLAEADLSTFFDWFAATPRTVSLFSMGANQSAQGVAKGLAILNAHLATGRIGKPGACPFSITGQPNAMGGRETGGMATTLAAHMDFDEVSRGRLARFWGADRVAEQPGLKAVDMFDAVADGRIKAIWIMATNPAVSMPNASRVRAALAACPFVVVSDCMAQTDTMAFAHVKLPALAWGEKDGAVTNSERRISRQRAVLPAPGEARADWRIVADVAAAMGHGEAFGWRSPAQVFREWARLTAYENADRPLNLGPLAGLSPDAYDALEPVQWPVTQAGGTARLFADGRFATPDGRAQMQPVRSAGPAHAVDAAFPLALNTGRVRDHWHTLTRTGLAPELCRHEPEPFVDIHPADAAAVGVTEGALTRVQTALGEAVVTARLSERQRVGGVFMPMHWTALRAVGPRQSAGLGPRGRPVGTARVQAHPGPRQALPRDLARLLPFPRHLADAEGSGPDLAAHPAGRVPAARVRGAGRRAGTRGPAHGPGARRGRRAPALRGRRGRGSARGPSDRRTAGPNAVHDDSGRAPTARLARRALRGRGPGSRRPHGPADRPRAGPDGRGWADDLRLPWCQSRVAAAIAAGAATLDAVGEATGAGSNCGSCRPEIVRLLKSSNPAEVRHAA